MHTDNGLLFELLNGSDRNDCVEAVANAVEEYLDSLAQRFTLVPAGTNVDFDIDFLEETPGPGPGQVAVLPQVRPDHVETLHQVAGCPEDPYKTHAGTHRDATASDATSTTTSGTASF